MSESLKIELGFALLALIQVVTAILREHWARARESKTREALAKVEESLRPAARISNEPDDQTPVLCDYCMHGVIVHEQGWGRCRSALCDCPYFVRRDVP